MPALKRKPNSRYEYNKPKIKPNGVPWTADVTERDIELWSKILAPYPVARLNMLYEFLGGKAGRGGDRKAFARHWEVLTRPPNNYVYRHSQQANQFSNGRSMVYGLNRNGYDALIKRGYQFVARDAPRNLEHELMWCEFMQSVQLGAQQHGVPFAGWQTGDQHIMDSKKLPEGTRLSSSPFDVPIIRTDKGKDVPGTAAADGPPFGIQMSDGWRFFAVQADCDSEPIVAQGMRSSIDRHMRDAIYILQKGLFEAHFGFPNLHFIFITPSITHLFNFMSHLKALTQHDQELRQYFLFAPFPTLHMKDRPIEDGRMFKEKYLRVDPYPTFTF